MGWLGLRERSCLWFAFLVSVYRGGAISAIIIFRPLGCVTYAPFLATNPRLSQRGLINCDAWLRPSLF